MIDWLETNATLLIGFSAVTFVVGLILMPILLIRMSEDYFVRRGLPEDSWRGRHPLVRWIMLILKNLFGILLLVAGAVMALPGLPGQGILTMLVGIGMTNIPGKRRLELYIIRRPVVLRSVNWIRSRAGRPPLRLPQQPGDGD